METDDDLYRRMGGAKHMNHMDVTNESLIKLQVILNGFPLFWSKLGQCT